MNDAEKVILTSVFLRLKQNKRGVLPLFFVLQIRVKRGIIIK